MASTSGNTDTKEGSTTEKGAAETNSTNDNSQYQIEKATKRDSRRYYICACQVCICGRSVDYPGDACDTCSRHAF
ncbi:hypothetical protein B0T26DRAFT_76097 [Lasiosphaeria miniovina]|uniref:Uncharacterized protein n=1 Tax=Lasiosphaeria miniovina TaxID=1954250 RepID=A0AA40BI00_9PEZI|nr:uncharacterized protein B0T26DRAFT_76097 [Lasiosphaeria miniovina]KAK0734577.1 hypothetical protein B0T26DRAFT_76097 [Lasiosphaeria miniovina]